MNWCVKLFAFCFCLLCAENFKVKKAPICVYTNIDLYVETGRWSLTLKLFIHSFQGSFISEMESAPFNSQKQQSSGVLRKRCSEIMQKIYRRTPMPKPKCDFNKVAKQLYWNRVSAWVFSVNLLHIFRAPFPRDTSGWLLLNNLLWNTNDCIAALTISITSRVSLWYRPCY